MSKLSLKQVYASYAPKVLNLLAEDETHMRVFGAELMLKIHDYKKAKDKDVSFEQTFMPLFMDKLYPSAQKNAQIAAWLCKAYLNHRHNGKAILAEDFYKVAESLKYFDALKNSKSLPEEKRDLLSYQSYQDLLDVLKPFEEKRMAKEAADAFRKLTPEQKQIIQDETTILYDGIEGQVVIPHTPRASQFWGSNTKWCIAGKEADNYFPDYNHHSPIVMILPKGMHDQKNRAG